MIDTHCHLQTEAFDADREQVIGQAESSGVQAFIVPAIDTQSFVGTLELAAAHPNVWCALGIHPHSAAQWNEEVREQIRTSVVSNPKIVAIGEIGLDYYYDFAPKETQVKAFREQIELALELQKPIIIHTRDSIEETIAICEEYYRDKELTHSFGQFHCFSGSPQQAQQIAALGFAVSFTGNITFKNSTLGATVAATPEESILIETDSPYLAPAPHRGTRNEPARVSLVAAKIAEIKQRAITDIMQLTTTNAIRIFRLPIAALLLVLLSMTLGTTTATAQPGSRPPDSVMTKDRREAEEMIRKQRDELMREQERRRQDSLRAVQQEQEEQQREMREQIRKDSIRAIERAQDEEKARQKALTPIAWKAITVGGGIGIGNLSELYQNNRKTLTPTSVFASSLILGTQITRGIDFEFSYNSFTVSDDLIGDNLYKISDSATPVAVSPLPEKKPAPPYTVPTHESINTQYLAFALRFTINPHSPVKFYGGVGYNYVTITNTQDYYGVTDSLGTRTPSATIKKSFSRGGINALFGARYDLEVGTQFIITPFAQISASFLFNGDPEYTGFVFQTVHDLITFTHLNVGATVSFGWFGVKRN